MAHQLPLFAPESTWSPPDPLDWPDFRGRGAKLIGFDTETDDPNLEKKGPGFVRGDATLCGVSLACEDGKKLYLPIGHSEGNVDRVQALRYVKEQLGGDQPKVGANLTYDLESLWSVGIDVNGPLRDIQIAEPLLDEEKLEGYSLEVLSRQYLGKGKSEDLLKEAGIAYGGNAKKLMSILPSKFVGLYAEDDAYDAIRVFEKQEQALIKDEVYHIFELEARLQRVLFLMRLRGVRVDLDKADYWSKKIQRRENQLFNAIRQMAGMPIKPSSGASVGRVLNSMGIDVPTTPAGGFSVTSDWLLTQQHPICRMINKWRKSQKMRSDFIDTLLHDNVNGRIHSNWQQLRDYDENGKSKGTRSGRIAASRFNLTQVPSRDPFWGPLIRSMFLADEGGFWCKADYSQQEPRILLHFAYLMSKTQMGAGRYEGVGRARDLYRADKKTDYHTMTQNLIIERTGQDIGRKRAKGINLGAAYGMGKYKLANQLGVSLETAEAILKVYHAGVPYVRDLGEDCMKIVNQRGFIKTILGRRRRFKLWEPARFDMKQSATPIADKEKAKELWGSIARAFAHKAMNAAVQGSAADQMKTAICNLYYDHGILPQVQVYDELNMTLDSMDDARLLQEVMEGAIPMEVPFLAEPETGPSWGETEDVAWAA